MAEVELKPFNPADFQDAVALKIRGEFASMIPDDQWKGLVKKHVEDFLKGDGKGTLREIVFAELKTKTEVLLKEYFAGSDWSFQFQGQQRVASEKIKQMILEGMPQIVLALVGEASQRTFENIRQQIGQNRGW